MNIAVCVHLYHHDMWDEIKEYLNNTSNNILTIQVISVDLAFINAKLTVSVLDADVLDQLGIQLYTQTQLINDPHSQGRTQFGSTIKFNSSGSFVVSAPASARYAETTFDASDDENEAHNQQVRNVLEEIGADEVPCLQVYNKIDLKYIRIVIQIKKHKILRQ